MINRHPYIHVYTGNGKGKTTAALGVSLRYLGHGGRVFFASFLKGQECGESRLCSTLSERMTYRQYGQASFVRSVTEKDEQLVNQGLYEISQTIQQATDPFGLLVLDEIHHLFSLNLLTQSSFLQFLHDLSSVDDIICTGRSAPSFLREMAAVVTSMECEKHYFSRGISARKGVDY
ncbi:cob(I)yrinic acid a,c-diamide adenosyltransferase [Chitinivibrio alkaliphilus]|uniref:corrinoid adenosyltransferase n=1 Tax=Chitinivibrio alkaliphilus ACht1 TaxID=1313304 RepID=U7D2Y9_9BACT|nr:cob(I)yrinic acid a,c-diamide adenosyltransferase [Chitinivibrio alkaliphilus]ERP30844.1 ATP:corrinoid adenosyltransferase BtuR/CobO/CobP [Chitinivibrio alkaliphilus ACht1]